MAAPTLDGVAHNTATNAASYTVTLTTTNANDIICVLVYVSKGSSGTAPAVTSVTASGLTFAKRASTNGSVQGNMELWWALSTSALTAKVITVTIPTTYDDTASVAFGVTGCYTASPWDNNSNVPKYLSQFSTPSHTGVSTNESNDFLIFANGSNGGWASLGTIPTGFTNGDIINTNGGALAGSVGFAYKGVTATQSSATFTWGSGVQQKNESIFDALTADAPVVPSTARPQVCVCT
jgi:hypothetical protein